jgi:hemoglobin
MIETTNDIESREDIDRLMQVFYRRAMTDDRIGRIFTDVARLDLEKHLPIIGDFWEAIIFGTRDYAARGRNPLKVHGDLNLKFPLVSAHFERWLSIFEMTVDDLFAGERADFAKMRAAAIARRMHGYVSGAETGIDVDSVQKIA